MKEFFPSFYYYLVSKYVHMWATITLITFFLHQILIFYKCLIFLFEYLIKNKEQMITSIFQWFRWSIEKDTTVYSLGWKNCSSCPKKNHIDMMFWANNHYISFIKKKKKTNSMNIWSIFSKISHAWISYSQVFYVNDDWFTS
jgi:hypothetical protein